MGRIRGPYRYSPYSDEQMHDIKVMLGSGVKVPSVSRLIGGSADVLYKRLRWGQEFIAQGKTHDDPDPKIAQCVQIARAEVEILHAAAAQVDTLLELSASPSTPESVRAKVSTFLVERLIPETFGKDQKLLDDYRALAELLEESDQKLDDEREKSAALAAHLRHHCDGVCEYASAPDA